jgi:twitching motility protein PilJ
MAKKSDNSFTFSLLAGLTAILLLVSGAILYLQPASGGSDPVTAELAALSQAIPLHAELAVRGDSGGFARFAADLDRMNAVRGGRSAGELPGSAGAWQQIDRLATTLLSRQADIEAIHAAAGFVNEHMPQMLDASNELLILSSATATIQEFQQRGAALQQNLAALATRPNLAPQVADDMAFLRQVVDALAGADSELDLTPLNAASRESALAPVVNELLGIEAQSNLAVTAAAQLGDLQEGLAELSQTSAGLLNSAFSAANGGTPSIVSQVIRYPPLGMLGLALLFLAGMYFLHSKAAVFERSSVIQTEQNERNQQAILRLLDELGSLADGDLTVEATVTEDITGAIADSINYAIEKLRELVITINETAILVDSAAKQTESTAAHMARAADNQGKEISAASESIVSMAGSISQVSGNAERSSDVARHSVDVAHKGGEAVRRTIDGMNTIRETIQETAKRIKRLGESSQEIGNIIELINDIAEQTNILALNASIQASMAGEAGRGFAVVADEVQRLAERSTNATKQIEVLVRTIQSDTNEAVVSMERSTTDVVGGALLAENAGAALDEIEKVSNQIASLVQNISGSARQQASSAADVTRRTTKLREISEQTGKATSATAASIAKLSELASQLRKTVDGFTLPGGAAIAPSTLSAAKSPPPPQPARASDRAVG